MDEETRALIAEAIDELYAAFVDDQTIKFWEGGIVRAAPTGAPPEYITVEIEGIYDENVEWRGVPPTPAVGDEVLVWENPITHRREVIAASGASGVTGGASWCQKVTVAKCGGDFTSPGAAIAWINALPAGQAPAATRLYAVNILGGNFAEAADLTIPQHVHMDAEGEATELEMGANTLIMSSDTSLSNIVVESSDPVDAIRINGQDNVVLRNVRCIQGTAADCFHVHGASTNVELYGCVAEATTVNAVGFHVGDTATVVLQNCIAEDTTNFVDALLVDAAASTVTTQGCRFAGSGDDVDTGAGSTWVYCNDDFDYRNCTVAGTAQPADGQPVVWFDYTVAAATAAAITDAIDWVKGRTVLGTYTIDVAAGAYDTSLVFEDIYLAEAGALVLEGDTRVLPALTYVSGPGTAAAWAALTAYAAGNIVQPTAPNDFYYKCQVAGTSGAAEPAWPTALNGTVVDGTVTWICCGIPNNRAGLANGGGTGAVCMIANAGNNITVTMTTTPGGVASNPNFQADGWDDGDRVKIHDNAGATNLYEIDSCVGNVITLKVAAPAVGNLGTSVTLIPDRSIDRTAAGPCIVNRADGVKLDGWYLETATGTDCDGVQALGGSIELENVAIQAEDNCIYVNDVVAVVANSGAVSLLEATYGLRADIGGVTMDVRYSIAVANTIAYYTLVGFIRADYCIATDPGSIGFYAGSAASIFCRYAYVLDSPFGFLAYHSGSLDGYYCVAESCTTAGFYCRYHGDMAVRYAAARNCGTGYHSQNNAYIYAANTNANNAGNTANYNPAVSDTEGATGGWMTWS